MKEESVSPHASGLTK